MNTTKNTAKAKASRKVLKKLSAVRAVLPKDQRDVLDAMILGEVQAHSLARSTDRTPARGAKKAKQQVSAHALARSTDRTPARGAKKAKQQVSAHSLARSTDRTPARGAKKAKQQVNAHVIRSTTRAADRGAKKAKQQVSAHARKRSANKAERATALDQAQAIPPQTAVQEAAIPQIEFDPNREEYRSVPE